MKVTLNASVTHKNVLRNNSLERFFDTLEKVIRKSRHPDAELSLLDARDLKEILLPFWGEAQKELFLEECVCRYVVHGEKEFSDEVENHRLESTLEKVLAWEDTKKVVIYRRKDGEWVQFKCVEK